MFLLFTNHSYETSETHAERLKSRGLIFLDSLDCLREIISWCCCCIQHICLFVFIFLTAITVINISYFVSNTFWWFLHIKLKMNFL